MKYYLHLPLLLLFTASAIGSEAINEEAAMEKNGRLKVSNVTGSVEIRGWSRNRIEVTGELGDNSELIFKVDGDSALVEIDSEGSKWNDREGTELIIRVPKSTRVTATTVSADLDVEEIEGKLWLQTVSGDLEAKIYGQEADAKSVSGDVDIIGNGKPGLLGCKSVSGDIEAVGVAGELDAASVSGEIEIESGEFSRLNANTVSGDIDFTGEMLAGARVEAESISGDVNLNLDSLYNTEYHLESFSGSINSILGVTAEKKSKYAPGRRLEMIEGDGESRIRIETMSGDIEIRATGKSGRKPDIQQTSSRQSGNRQVSLDFYEAIADLDAAMHAHGDNHHAVRQPGSQE